MTHLLYHLVDELDVCGLVATRWINSIERYMKTLKLYMCNMAQLEASMVEGYVQNECLCFIIEYLQKFDIVKRRIWDADEEEGDVGEVLEGVGSKFHMSSTLHDLAHQYVLTNIAIMVPWAQ